MVAALQNHPSVFTWSVGNELRPEPTIVRAALLRAGAPAGQAARPDAAGVARHPGLPGRRLPGRLRAVRPARPERLLRLVPRPRRHGRRPREPVRLPRPDARVLPEQGADGHRVRRRGQPPRPVRGARHLRVPGRLARLPPGVVRDQAVAVGRDHDVPGVLVPARLERRQPAAAARPSTRRASSTCNGNPKPGAAGRGRLVPPDAAVRPAGGRDERLRSVCRLPSSVVCLLLLAAPAQAGYFPGQPVDGPSADIDVARRRRRCRATATATSSTSSARRAPTTSSSRCSATATPRQPRRLDAGQPLPSSQPRIASRRQRPRASRCGSTAGRSGRRCGPNGSTDWGAPEASTTAPPAGADASDPYLSMGRSGAAYVAFQVGGDLRVARLSGTTWTLIERAARHRARRASRPTPTIATSADGTALGRLVARAARCSRAASCARGCRRSRRRSACPSLDGRAAGAADSPSVDIEDDSSYAWVAVRQDFDGVSRVFARRLVGSQFEAPVAIDAGSRRRRGARRWT